MPTVAGRVGSGREGRVVTVHAEVREGSRMDIHGTVPYDTGPRIDNTVSYDTREWIHGTRTVALCSATVLYRYDTGLHSRCLQGLSGSNIAPRQLTLKSDSSGTITSVMYALGTSEERLFRQSVDSPSSRFKSARLRHIYPRKIVRHGSFLHLKFFDRFAASKSRRYGHILWQTAKA